MGTTVETRFITGLHFLASVTPTRRTRVSGPGWSTTWKPLFVAELYRTVWKKFTSICWVSGDRLASGESGSSDFQSSTFLMQILVYLDQLAFLSM